MALPRGEVSSQRLSEATTSSELISRPLWNLTPWRKAISCVNPPSLTLGSPSASIGTTFQLAS